MGELIEEGFVRKNKDNSIRPAVWDRVEKELDGYGVNDGTVEETYQQVLSRLAN